MNCFCIYGDLTKDDVLAALKLSYPLKLVHVSDFDSNNLPSAKWSAENNRHKFTDSIEGIFMTTSSDAIESLKYEIELRDREIRALEEHNLRSLEELRSINTEHEKLLQDFTLLRQKYDEKKQSLLDMLWTQCSKYNPDLCGIPELTECNNIDETENNVGEYVLGSLLGDGKYGVVKSCHHRETGLSYAVKIVSKDKITTITALQRLSREIEILRSCKSAHVVRLQNALQTRRYLYIFMERGGPDLFELISMYPNGLREEWSKDIMTNVVKAVKSCHDQDIFHRG